MRIDKLSIEPTFTGVFGVFFVEDNADCDRLAQLIKDSKEKGVAIISEFKLEKGKRSLNANAYHYLLCDRIAKALGTTQIEVHNQLLADYGTLYTTDSLPQFILLKDNDDYLRELDFHLKPTPNTEDRKGTTYRWFARVKPSREYDTAEMSKLIDGTIYEAKELNIETLTQDELNKLKSMWK